jgi:hypothetical protein
MSQQSLALYRAFLKEARQLKQAPPVARKLCYNARQLWSFYAHVKEPDTLHGLHEQARAAVRVVRWLKALPKASGQVMWQPSPCDRGSLPRRRECKPYSIQPPPPAAACIAQEHSEELLKHYRNSVKQ